MSIAGALARPPETVRSLPDLGRIKHAAERVASAAYNVETFRNRFYGAVPETERAADDGESTYRNDLNDLFEQIDRLEAVVSGLIDIG